MFDLTKMRKEQGTTNWFCEGQDGSELFVGGTDEGPLASALTDATLIVSEYEQIKTKAISLLESFIKDRGSWHVGATVVGPFQSPKDGDFTVELGFESDHNGHEYSSTGFTVHFTLNKKGRNLGLDSHPFKFTVEIS